MVFQAREGNFLKKKYYGRARRNYLSYPFLKWEQTAVSILAVVFRFWTIPNRGDLAMASTSQEKHVEKATSNYQNRSRLNGCRFWIYLGVGHALKKLRVLCGGVLNRMPDVKYWNVWSENKHAFKTPLPRICIGNRFPCYECFIYTDINLTSVKVAVCHRAMGIRNQKLNRTPHSGPSAKNTKAHSHPPMD